MSEPLTVRAVELRDPRVAEVLVASFPSDAEARLVYALAVDAPALIEGLSLGAFEGERLLGYILFTRVWVGEGSAEAISLAPLAVVPDARGRRIGKLLVLEGLRRARGADEPAAIVLGYPDYYTKFGFEQARARGIVPPWPDVPDEAWLALELREGGLKSLRGVVQYAAAFNEVI